MPLVQICFIKHLNAPEDPALRDIRQKYSLKAEMQLKGRWSKEKTKKAYEKETLPGCRGGQRLPRGAAGAPWGPSRQGQAGRACPTTPARTRAARGAQGSPRYWEPL